VKRRIVPVTADQSAVVTSKTWLQPVSGDKPVELDGSAAFVCENPAQTSNSNNLTSEIIFFRITGK
jgi:hypothetical protein